MFEVLNFVIVQAAFCAKSQPVAAGRSLENVQGFYGDEIDVGSLLIIDQHTFEGS